MNVLLPPDLASFVRDQVASGHFCMEAQEIVLVQG